MQLNAKGTNIWTWVKDDDVSVDPEVAFGVEVGKFTLQ